MKIPGRFFLKSTQLVLAVLTLSVLSPALLAETATVEDVRSIARLYSAAFDREPKDDGLNFWVDSFEQGSPLTAISDRFNRSPEFTKKYGPLDITGFVEQLFRNVLRRDGKQAGIDFWVRSLDGGTSRATVLEKFAGSPENITKTTATFADMRLEAGGWTYKSKPTNNLVASSLEIESLDPRIGYPLELSITIDAAELAEDVGVTFYAFEEGQAGNDVFYIGASVIEEVSAGSDSYIIEIDIPTEIKNPQTYFIGAFVDPANLIAETSEQDNRTSTEVALSAPLSPNLFIEFMEPDRTALVLDRTAWDYVERISTNGEINSDAGGTVRWGGQGIEEEIDVEAFANLRLYRSDDTTGPTGPIALSVNPGPGNSLNVPLYLWNSEVQRYMNAYGIDPVLGGNTGVEEWLPIGQVGRPTTSPDSEFDLRSVHLDFYFPGRLASEIEISLRHLPIFLGGPILPPPDLSADDIQEIRSFLGGAELEEVTSEFCLSIRPADQRIVEASLDDNTICSPLQLVLPPVEVSPPVPPPPPPRPPLFSKPVNPIFFSANYLGGWPGYFFGVGVDVSASSSVDTNGVVIRGNVDIPVTIFGGNFQFVGIEARAQVLPLSIRFADPEDQPDPGFSLTISSLDQVIFVTNRPPTGSTGALSASYSIEIPDPDKKIPTFTYVGPVRVTVDAGLSGNIGVEGEVEFGSPTLQGINYKTEFFESAEVFAKASASIIVGRIGAEGVVTLLKYAFPIDNRSTINIEDNRHSDGTSEVVIVDQFLVKNEISGPAGALNLFVELGGGEECDWGVFSFICRVLPSIKYTLNLVEWEPFEKEEIILRNDVDTIDIITLPDNTVVFYGE